MEVRESAFQAGTLTTHLHNSFHLNFHLTYVKEL